MSCIRSCYDKDSSNFGHDDCPTCIHKDAPPQRTWVGLTEEEKQTCIRQIDELGKYSTHTVADDERLLIDVVESKLRSKNA